MKLDTRKLYTSKGIIEIEGYRRFQDLLASGRIVWIKDDSFGNKLYWVHV